MRSRLLPITLHESTMLSVIRRSLLRQLAKPEKWTGLKNFQRLTPSAYFGTGPQVRSAVKEVENGIEFSVGDSKDKRFVDYLWLFDNCRCPKCYLAKVNQKLIDPRDITPDIKPKAMQLKGDDLNLTWTDGHEYTYNLNFILSNIYSGVPSMATLKVKVIIKPKLWKTLKPEEFPTVSSKINRENMVKRVLSDIVVHGFSLITDVEPTLEASREVFESIAPIQKGYFWGEVFTIQPQEEFPNNAYTNDHLWPHTDAAHIQESPGVQLIHILKKSSDGGASTLNDSFYIAEEFKKKDPESYKCITTTPVESNYKVEVLQCFYKHCETVLRLHPYTKEPIQIRFNPTDIIPIKTIPQEEIRKWYKSFGAFVTELYDPSNGIEFVLNPGTMLVFDNWRLLHGRKSFVGHRQLCGGFISNTEFRSRARLLGLID